MGAFLSKGYPRLRIVILVFLIIGFIILIVQYINADSSVRQWKQKSLYGSSGILFIWTLFSISGIASFNSYKKERDECDRMKSELLKARSTNPVPQAAVVRQN